MASNTLTIKIKLVAMHHVTGKDSEKTKYVAFTFAFNDIVEIFVVNLTTSRQYFDVDLDDYIWGEKIEVK